jgi:hypothetical protein
MRKHIRPRLPSLAFACSLCAVALSDAPPAAARVDALNAVLGTQTIGVKYGFTDQTRLVETAERILEMGSGILKITLSGKMDEAYGLPKRDDVRSLTDLVSRDPSVKRVFDMPFAYYHLWVYPFAHRDSSWKDGFTEQERQHEYDEVRALALYLLKTYAGTGKTFYFGHWEGDWSLLAGYDKNLAPAPEAVQGMIDWLNVRQTAVDDATREAGARDVKIYTYTEANLVQKGMKGGPCVVNSVLPHTRVDYVSYSSYDTINPHKGDTRQALREALDFIESKLPPKPGLGGKRVFIGEYGFPLSKTTTPELQDLYSRDVCRAALEWGCPFVLYWEFYCNEIADGKHRGFWLIDDKNQKQPFYYTLQRYYEGLRRYAADCKAKSGRTPTDDELRAKALELLAAPAAGSAAQPHVGK